MSNGYIKYRLNDKPNENYLRGDRVCMSSRYKTKQKIAKQMGVLHIYLYHPFSIQGKHFGREKGLLSRLANLIMSSDDMYSGVVVKCTNTKSAHISVEWDSEIRDKIQLIAMKHTENKKMGKRTRTREKKNKTNI